MSTDVIIGILLLLTYLAMVVYTTRGGNLLSGFIVLALLWVIIGRIPYAKAIVDIFETPAENYGPTIAVIIFGSWFGRVLVETGIARTIIKKTVEFAGDKPLITNILLSLVTALIFTSAFGVGSVMAIGIIVLPILFSLGIPKRTAVLSYIMAVAAGMYLNIAYVKQIQAFFPEVKYDNVYIKFAVIATLVHVIVMLAFIIFSHVRNKVNHAWAASSIDETDKELPSIVFIVPIIPILMVIFFKWQPIPAFLLGIFVGLIFTGNIVNYERAIEKIQKTLYDGVADVGLLIGMLYSIIMFSAAAKYAAPYLGKLIGNVIPHNPFMLTLTFGLLAPLALFRGPLMIFGSGAATLAILQGMNIFDPRFLFGLILIPPVAIVANTCPTQSWGMWAITYSKMTPGDYVKTGLIWSWIIAFINELVAFYLI